MRADSVQRLLIVGNPEEYHIGAHFLSAARELGIEAALVDIRETHSRHIWVRRIFNRCFRRRPVHLTRFSRDLVIRAREFRPQLLLVTGIAAPHATALKRIGQQGVHRCNFLTDDPWSPVNGVSFFWAALPEYDSIWSPRRSNLQDLQRHGCKHVQYLPFGYNPKIHFAEPPQEDSQRRQFSCDVVFVGGADPDRVLLVRALVGAGLNVHLYGGYWDREPDLRAHWRGLVVGRDFRMAVGGAKINIALGRRLNRDGHAMRSLELPAMGACLLVEDTAEHRDLFGPEGVCVEYYRTTDQLVQKTQYLLNRPEERARMKQRTLLLMRSGRHTYADRLTAIVNTRQASC